MTITVIFTGKGGNAGKTVDFYRFGRTEVYTCVAHIAESLFIPTGPVLFHADFPGETNL